MDWLHHLLWYHDKFLGITWNAWKCIGLAANVLFSTRIVVQWYAMEKRKQVVVPILYWWLSLAGTVLFLAYSVFYEKDPVYILAYAFPWIPYARNLVIHYRHERLRQTCPDCGIKAPPAAGFCGQCGARLAAPPVAASQPR
jgi:lipid-A-disaccharide synthase-like uncharacterized protein